MRQHLRARAEELERHGYNIKYAAARPAYDPSDDPRGRGAHPRSAVRDALLVGAGTAVGAGLGYGATALLKKRYGEAFKGSSPESRLKYLVPAATAAGALAPLVHVLRQRAEMRADQEQRHASGDGRS